MNVAITQENFNRALSGVGRVASAKASLPILNNILLKTDNNRLLIAATNLEIAITEHIGAKVETDGAITIPSRLLIDFIHNLPKSTIELVVEGTNLHIKSAQYTSTIHGALAEDFPELPTINPKHTITISKSVLKRAITQTVVTASSDSTRPVLTGIYVYIHEGDLYFAATDGYRLAERVIQKQTGTLAAIIPASTLQDVLRVLPEDLDEVTLVFDETQVRFRLGDVEVTSRLIDGAFPDYRQLIPKTTDVSVQISKDELIRIVKIASLFARDSGGSITLKTDHKKGLLSIHSIASQLGENTSYADAKVSGDGVITLNSRYLLEALGCIDGEGVEFSFSGKLAPAILRSDSKNTDYQHIIMPLKS